MRAMNLTGERFGRLTVVSRAERNTSTGQTMWVCRCDCGGSNTARGTHLRAGRISSCGCLARELLQKPDEEITYNSAHYRVKRARGFPHTRTCIGCGATAQTWALRHDAPVTHLGDDGKGHAVRYSGRPEDYDPMCHKCHWQYDRGPDEEAHREGDTTPAHTALAAPVASDL